MLLYISNLLNYQPTIVKLGTAGTPAINIFAIDLTFIDTVMSELISRNILTRDEVLKQYPKDLRNAYLQYKHKKGNQWYVVPATNGIAFAQKMENLLWLAL